MSSFIFYTSNLKQKTKKLKIKNIIRNENEENDISLRWLNCLMRVAQVNKTVIALKALQVYKSG